MAVERYLKENATGYIQLEDGSGVLLLESSGDAEQRTLTNPAVLYHKIIKPRRKSNGR